MFTSLMAGASFLVAGYQSFVAQKSMLKRLYGEEDFDCSAREETTDADASKDALRAKIEKRRDYNASYCFYTMINYFKCLCCCFVACCRARCRRYFEGNRKFEIA